MVILLAYLGRFPVKPPSKRDPNSSTSLVFLFLGFPPLLLLATRSSASNSASTSSWIFSRSFLLREEPPPDQSIQRNVISREQTEERIQYYISREREGRKKQYLEGSREPLRAAEPWLQTLQRHRPSSFWTVSSMIWMPLLNRCVFRLELFSMEPPYL